MFMTAFYGEMLILLLTIVTCARVFFIEHTRIDSIVLFAPLAFVISIFQILSWGINLAEITLFYFSFYVFFINWRGVLRFVNHLYVDTYSILFKISSSVGLILSVAFIALFSYFFPIHEDAKKNNVTVETQIFTKNFHNEFVNATNKIAKKDMVLKIYKPSTSESHKTTQNDFIILFVPDKRAPKDSYASYLVELAKKGFTIYSADFGFSTISNSLFSSTEFLQNFNFIPNSILKNSLIKKSAENPSKYFFENQKYAYAYAKEFEILNKIADKNESQSKKFVLVADEIPSKSFAKISQNLLSRKIEKSFSLNSISDEIYKTKGFGFIEQSAPLEAKFYFDLEKDKNFTSPKNASRTTAKFFLDF